MSAYAVPSDVPVAFLRETLAHEKQLWWRLEGQSMMPTLRPESVILVHPIVGAVRLGTIVLFEQGGAVVAHRIMQRRGGGYVAQGDNRQVPDGWVAPEQIIGVVVQATYNETLYYAIKENSPVALFWLLRYYWLKGRRFIHRLAARTVK